MKNDELVKIIEDLIKLGKEGEYWDFKQQPETSLDQIHDIICLANNPHHTGERYLIYGVSDNFEVVGIEKDKIVQANIVDTLRNSGFSNNNFPDISVENIIVYEKNLSIIVIKDRPNFRPYTLEKLLKKQVTLYPGAIYTRTQDTNTPKDKTASPTDCEKIWRQHFGIDEPVFERFKRLLLEPENWIHNPGNSYIPTPNDFIKHGEPVRHDHFPVYHRIFPEFQIELSDGEERKGETFCYSYIRPESHWGEIYLKYHNTVIAKFGYVHCDNYQILLPVPNIFLLEKNFEKPTFFFYIMEDTLEGW